MSINAKIKPKEPETNENARFNLKVLKTELNFQSNSHNIRNDHHGNSANGRLGWNTNLEITEKCQK